MARKDLVKETVSEIEEWIESGKFSNEELLPSELDISKQLNVSRATVRDAIRTLEVRGFVERLHGIGVRVNNRSMDVAISFLASMIQRDNITYRELMEIRVLIEPKACALAAQNASVEDLEALKVCVESMESNDRRSKIHQESDYNFHTQIARASGNRLLYTIVESYSPLLFNQIDEANKQGTLSESQLHFHEKIYQCLVNRDSEGAKENMLIHLSEAEHNLNSALNE